MWKRKGNKKDKNTWRGITLLSAGTKIIARIVADRAQKWLEEGEICEQQCGFRKGRGIDDAHQVTRRIAEEVIRSTEGEEIIMDFHDIEKAYPRTCRKALWHLLRRQGCDDRFVAVARALHDHTEVVVRI